jgi:hypothetical protein
LGACRAVPGGQAFLLLVEENWVNPLFDSIKKYAMILPYPVPLWEAKRVRFRLIVIIEVFPSANLNSPPRNFMLESPLREEDPKACFFFLKIPFRKTEFPLSRNISPLAALGNRWLKERTPGR